MPATTLRPSMARDRGYTLVEIMIVVAIIGLLAAIAIPSLTRARESAQATVCVRIQQAMAGAKAQAALEHNWNNDTSFGSLGGDYQLILADYLRQSSKLSVELGSGADRPTCPLGYQIFWNAIGEEVVCQSGLATHIPPVR